MGGSNQLQQLKEKQEADDKELPSFGFFVNRAVNLYRKRAIYMARYEGIKIAEQKLVVHKEALEDFKASVYKPKHINHFNKGKFLQRVQRLEQYQVECNEMFAQLNAVKAQFLADLGRDGDMFADDVLASLYRQLQDDIVNSVQEIAPKSS